jgi:2OG-Fe(II) oxygenase superfamily
MNNILSENPFIAVFDHVLDNNLIPLLKSVEFKPNQGSARYPHSKKNNQIPRLITWDCSTGYANPDITQQVIDQIVSYLKKNTGDAYNSNPDTVICQINQYKENQYFSSHVDYYDPSYFNKLKKKNPNLKPKDNRIAAVVIYLNDDFQGGETEFNLLNLTVKPQTGRILYIKYADHGQTDLLTLHEAKPILKGTKYIVTMLFTQLHSINESNI